MAETKTVTAKQTEAKTQSANAQNFDKPMTQADVMNMMRANEEFNNTNNVELTGRVVEKYTYPLEPKQILKDGVPVIDNETGEPRYYPQTNYVKIAFTGGETEIIERNDWQIELGSTYQFLGRVGAVKKFGKEETGFIFTDFRANPFMSAN